MVGIDINQLITLVQERPCVWDKGLGECHDLKISGDAWKDICDKLNENYKDLSDRAKIDYEIEVLGKWVHLRDTYRHLVRDQVNPKPGQRKSKRIFLYSEQLLFLKRTFDANDLAHTPPLYTKVSRKKTDEMVALDFSMPSTSSNPDEQPPKKIKVSRKWANVYEKFDDKKLSFYKAILPSMGDFSLDEIVEFQLAVLQVIRTIRASRYVSLYANRAEFSPNQPFFPSSTYNLHQRQSFYGATPQNCPNSHPPAKETTPPPECAESSTDSSDAEFFQ